VKRNFDRGPEAVF